MSARVLCAMRLASFTLALAILAVPASAGPVTITFSGTVGGVSAPGTVNEIGLGSSFSGVMQWDPTVGYSSSQSGAFGTYVNYYYPYVSFDLWIEGNHYEMNPSAYSGMSVYNDTDLWGTGAFDGFSGSIGLSGPGVTGMEGSVPTSYPVYRFTFSLRGPTSLFDSWVLPTGPLDVSAFTGGNLFSLEFYDASRNTLWPAFRGGFGEFDVTSSVPDPGSCLLLFGISLAGLTALRKRIQ